MAKQSNQSDIGLIGLAVMGQNLVLNMADHGYKVSVYNRTTSKMEAFIKDCEEKTRPDQTASASGQTAAA